MLSSYCVVLVFPELLVCAQKYWFAAEVSEASHDCGVKTPVPRKWTLTRCGGKEFGDVFWRDIPQLHESTQVMTKNAGHQMKETEREKQVENELMNQYLCKWRRKMTSGGEQGGQNVEFVVLERPKRSNDTFKCWIQSALSLCETSPLFELACQRGLGIAGKVRSMSTKTHVSETDGSCTNPSEAGLGKGKGECEKTCENTRKSSKMHRTPLLV